MKRKKKEIGRAGGERRNKGEGETKIATKKQDSKSSNRTEDISNDGTRTA